MLSVLTYVPSKTKRDFKKWQLSHKQLFSSQFLSLWMEV